MTAGRRILVGVVVGAHGVRGELKIKSFTATPQAIARYALGDRAGQRAFRLKLRGSVRGVLIARLDGVDDRDAADALRGLELYVDRDALPKTRGAEWYVADLEGLAAVDTGGRALGRVKTVHNFGAGDVIEIERGDGTSLILPFTKRVVPEVDIAAGRVVLDPPAEVEAKPESAAAPASSDAMGVLAR